MFQKTIPVVFLKAVYTKKIWIENYVRSDGVAVPGHYATVHIADDHDDAKVATGKGTFSQKKAHKVLSKEQFFHGLPTWHQAALVQEHAYQVQKKQSDAAKISKYQQAILSGGKPSSSEIKAFLELPKQKQLAILLKFKEAGQKYVLASNLAVGDYIENTGFIPDSIAHLPAENTKPKPEIESAPKDTPSHSDDHYAALLADFELLPKGNNKKQAIEELKKHPDWASWSKVEQHAKTLELYQKKQANATLSASISKFKSALVAGKTPTPSQEAALLSLPLHQAFDVLSSLNGKVAESVLDGYLSKVDKANPSAANKHAPEAPKKKVVKAKVVKTGPQEGDTKNGADGLLQFKNGRWHKADSASSVSAPKPTEKTPKPKTKQTNKSVGVLDANAWVQVGPQAGSNAGGKFKDANGVEWYCKFPSDSNAVSNEYLAAKFYQMLGVSVSSLTLIEKDGKKGIASKWVEGLKQGSASELSSAKGVHEAFVIDAWLANWDVVGMSNDNLKLNASGAVRVDVGGALDYRAMGKKKGKAFGNDVPELETMLDSSKNPSAAAVFGGVSKDALAWGVVQLNKLKPSQIEDLVEKCGPGTRKDKETLAAKLIARRKYILDKFGVKDQWRKVDLDETSLPVNPADLPKPIDFFTINAGEPLSSHPEVNQLNSNDSAAMIAFAAKGNLVALKNYEYDAINKKTKKVVGKAPIIYHPSKHIKEQWVSLVELLQSIAHPPIESLPMPSMGAAQTIEELSEMVGYFKPEDRVETISPEQRMGFFMKLGSVDAVESLLKGVNWEYLTPKSPWVFKQHRKFENLPPAVKGYIHAVQKDGLVNHVFSQGKGSVNVKNYNGGVQGLACQIYQSAVLVPEGTILYRGMVDTTLNKTMSKQLLEAKPGLIIQNTDSMCASYNKHHVWSGDIQMKIRCAKGAKCTPSFSSGNYSGEHEMTTLPGQRFMVVDAKKTNDSSIFLDVIMLPPHDGYLSELKELALMGKSIFVLFKRIK